MAKAVINTGSQIGNGVIVNTGAIIEHHNRVGDFSHIAVGGSLGGDVSVGKNVWVGMGAIIRNGLSLKAGAVIGAGAVVVKDITKEGTYVGIPASLLNPHLNHA